MGQYYYPIILTAAGGRLVGSFYSHDYDNGLKLTEHSYYGNEFVEAVISKAMSEYKPVTIVWLGDYADLSDDILPLDAHRCTNPAANKGKIGRDYVRMFLKAERARDWTVRRIKPDDSGVKECLQYARRCVVYNTVTRQKIVLSKYGENVVARRLENGALPHFAADFILHPLPLLTCLGNGKGGGDYRGTCMEWVGAWAFHVLAFLPEGLPEPDGEWEDISTQIIFEEDR